MQKAEDCDLIFCVQARFASKFNSEFGTSNLIYVLSAVNSVAGPHATRFGGVSEADFTKKRSELQINVLVWRRPVFCNTLPTFGSRRLIREFDLPTISLYMCSLYANLGKPTLQTFVILEARRACISTT